MDLWSLFLGRSDVPNTKERIILALQPKKIHKTLFRRFILSQFTSQFILSAFIISAYVIDFAINIIYEKLW